MPNKNYVRGVFIERVAIQELNEEGYFVSRSAQSGGLWDVVAVNEKEVKLVQCKRIKKGRSIESVTDGNLNVFKNIKVQPVVSKELWVWRDGEDWVLKRKI